MTDFSAQYRIEFAKTASLLLQQRGSKLRNHVMVGSHKGEGASPVDQYGVTEARERTGRAVPKESANLWPPAAVPLLTDCLRLVEVGGAAVTPGLSGRWPASVPSYPPPCFGGASFWHTESGTAMGRYVE